MRPLPDASGRTVSPRPVIGCSGERPRPQRSPAAASQAGRSARFAAASTCDASPPALERRRRRRRSRHRRARTTPPTAAAASSISRPAPRAAFDARDEPRARAWISATRRSCRTCSRSSPARWSISRTTTAPTTTCSRCRRRKPFDLGRYAAGHSKAVRFDRPGHRARVLRHPLAHERVHPGLRAPLLRGDRRRRALPDRQRAARAPTPWWRGTRPAPDRLAAGRDPGGRRRRGRELRSAR